MPRLLFALILFLFHLLPVAYAQESQVSRIAPTIEAGQLLIEADIDFTLSGELRNAAQKGVPLYFTVDLEIREPRWWWFDKALVTTGQTWRIQFNALTRQWRVTLDDLSLPATTLDEALNLVRHIRDWRVGPISQFKPDVDYQGLLRLRLDTARLARPFQVDALNSNAWSLTTPWKNFTFTVSADTLRD
ncbi:DUF4390 domain-containing protein [Castellaniella sp.]|uniref:DUF4390 domain-containing protein n=1 Tax=Castellaniella sp. TaxID=1955812 RepID=UPI002AFE8ABB|nr:DUF4390 domain-containing protein [Castellaniella sp.]